MAIEFTPLHPTIGAECTGVDISRPLTPAAAAAIDAGMDTYAVLVFRQGAPLTTAEQIAFTRNFGELGIRNEIGNFLIARLLKHQIAHPQNHKRRHADLRQDVFAIPLGYGIEIHALHDEKGRVVLDGQIFT